MRAFGLFDYSMLPKLNRILKPFGVVLKSKTNVEWGDQVEITAEWRGELQREGKREKPRE